MLVDREFNAQDAWEAYRLHSRFRGPETSELLRHELEPVIDHVLLTKRFRGFTPSVKHELRLLLGEMVFAWSAKPALPFKSPRQLEAQVLADLSTGCKNFVRAYNQTHKQKASHVYPGAPTKRLKPKL